MSQDNVETVRVLLDGEAPGPSHGLDVDEDGNGLLRDGRLYQLARERNAVRERRGPAARRGRVAAS